MRVFEPVRMGTLHLKNRLLMAPVKTAFGSPEGGVTQRLVDYYRRRAEGGVGAIIVEPMYVAAAGQEHPRQLAADRDETIEPLRGLVTTIQRAGSRAVAHLNHAGRAANPKASGQRPEAPSEVGCPGTGAKPEALSRRRIAEIVRAFGDGAHRVREAGFDAVEIQCGLGYLVAQFLSARTNQRRDDYGGNELQRRRFAREVLDAVRAAVGERFPILARISASEQVEGGLTEEDGHSLARWLEGRGVAAVHVVSGSACDSPPWYYQHMSLPPHANSLMAERVKQQVSIPVVAAGRLGDPDEINRLIGRAGVDLVALGRPLVADPDLPDKLRRGTPESIVRCGGCLQGCLTGVKSGRGLGCIVNPEVGREGELRPLPAAPRQILVIGAGPAGLTAARVAADRGHRVTLMEKSEHTLGGQFSLSHLAPGKAAMRETLKSLIRQTRRSTTDIRLGITVDRDLVAELAPDAVVVATGARPVMPDIPGLEGAASGEAVLSGDAKVGPRALIVGGGLVGIEVAEHLAENGHEVIVVEMLSEIARDMEPITRKLTLKRLAELPVKIHTGTKVSRFEDGRAVAHGPGGEEDLGRFDSVIMAVGTRPRRALADDLTGLGIEVHTVGDAARLEQVQGAVRSAWEVASRL